MKITTQKIVFILFVVFLYVVPADTAHAHGGLGLNFTSTTTEGYIVDVDYSDLYMEAGTIGRFDFGLFADETRQKQITFTDIWVRITEKDGSRVGNTLFAGAVAKQEFGGNGFSYMFPKGGTYTLDLRYNDASKGDFGETVGEAEFELNVLRSSDESTFKFRMEFWVGLLAGLLGATISILPLILRNKKA